MAIASVLKRKHFIDLAIGELIKRRISEGTAMPQL